MKISHHPFPALGHLVQLFTEFTENCWNHLLLYMYQVSTTVSSDAEGASGRNCFSFLFYQVSWDLMNLVRVFEQRGLEPR
jgi:hypothetical protein